MFAQNITLHVMFWRTLSLNWWLWPWKVSGLAIGLSRHQELFNKAFSGACCCKRIITCVYKPDPSVGLNSARVTVSSLRDTSGEKTALLEDRPPTTLLCNHNCSYLLLDPSKHLSILWTIPIPFWIQFKPEKTSMNNTWYDFILGDTTVIHPFVHSFNL